MAHELFSYCLCCLPGRRARGRGANGSTSGGDASESTPLLGDPSAASSSSNGLGLSSAGRKGSASAGGVAGTSRGAEPFPSKNGASPTPGSATALVDSTAPGATQASALTGPPQPPPYSVEDLAAITAWARCNFVDVASGGRRSTSRRGTTANGAERSNTAKSEASVIEESANPKAQGILEDLAKAVATSGEAAASAPSTAGSDAAAVAAAQEDEASGQGGNVEP